MSRKAPSELEEYMLPFKNLPLLTAEQEIELANQRDAGDPAAIEKLITHNMRLVAKIALEHWSHENSLPLVDLVTEGALGLEKGAQKFDPKRECRFSTYATWWIRQRIRRAKIDQGHTVRVPCYMVELVSKLKALMSEEGVNLTKAMEQLGIDNIQAREGVISASSIMGKCWIPFSLRETRSMPLRYCSVKSKHRPVHSYEYEEKMAWLEKGLEELKKEDEREYQVLIMRYGLNGEEPMTLKAVGKKLGVCRERVRQMQKGALKRMYWRLRQTTKG